MVPWQSAKSSLHIPWCMQDWGEQDPPPPLKKSRPCHNRVQDAWDTSICTSHTSQSLWCLKYVSVEPEQKSSHRLFQTFQPNFFRLLRFLNIFWSPVFQRQKKTKRAIRNWAIFTEFTLYKEQVNNFYSKGYSKFLINVIFFCTKRHILWQNQQMKKVVFRMKKETLDVVHCSLSMWAQILDILDENRS